MGAPKIDTITEQATNSMEQSASDYEIKKSSNIGLILWLILFFPVGLYLMWKRRAFSMSARIGVTVLIAFIFLSGKFNSKSGQNRKIESAVAAPNGQVPIENISEKSSTPQINISDSQRSFVIAVEKFNLPYRSAPNELKKSTLRRERAQEIRSSLPSTNISGWIGQLKGMGTTSEGKAYIEIQLEGSDISVKTWNNAISDIVDKTLIAPDSDLYNAIAQLSKGDRIAFSGKFLSGNKDHVKEGSMTEDGSMTDPEFLMRFASLLKHQ